MKTADLRELLAIARDLDEPTVDLGRLIGIRMQVHIQVESLAAALALYEEPTVTLRIGGASLSMHRQDGGLLAEFSLGEW